MLELDGLSIIIPFKVGEDLLDVLNFQRDSSIANHGVAIIAYIKVPPSDASAILSMRVSY